MQCEWNPASAGIRTVCRRADIRDRRRHLIPAPAGAPDIGAATNGRPTNQSLEALLNVKVVSASKTDPAISLSRMTVAIFVIAQEDNRRSGATDVPDLLRIVPGMDVAQIDGETWVINARGFDRRFGNELFVMVDGRSVSASAVSEVAFTSPPERSSDSS
jgi:outer membrane receptor for ferrienterochelin and colicin